MERVDWQEAGQGITSKLIKHRDYYVPGDRASGDTPVPAHIFKFPGDQIEGLLLSGPHTAFRRNSYYYLLVDEDHYLVKGYPEPKVIVFGNKQLHKIIRDNNLVGARVRIQMIGRQAQGWGGRPRKVYRVWHDKGMIFKNETEVK